MQATNLDDLCSVIGYTATRVLATWFSGRQLYVPGVPRDNHPLIRLIGRSAFVALSREFGDSHVRIPGSDEEDRYRRNRDIARRLADGATCESVADDLGMQVRRVRKLREQMERDGWLDYARGARARRLRRHARPRLLVEPAEAT